ncbi:MAG: hypothetical protein LBG65_02540, partial [Puniceicoccales bacterium]|nr:hypothetical protein [Puniceicoccales bacterium]
HANNGSTIALHDEIKAVAAAGNTEGYTVTIQGGTFSQIGLNARVFIPGATTSSGIMHLLSGGARYQTYDANGAPFGSYTLSPNVTLAAKGTGNVLASKKYIFQVGSRRNSASSTLGFDLTGATPGAGTALLMLAGGEVDTANGGLLGQNNVALSGNVTTPGNYYLLNATTTTATGQTSPVNTTGGTLLTDSLTFNGNPVTPFSAVISRPTGGRIYATATLNTGTPGGTTTGDKLYVDIANTDYNIVNSWTGQSDRNWKAELSTTGNGNWDGQMYVNDQGATATTNTFLNGDVVKFPKSTSGGTINVDPAGVIVGGMTMNAGGDITFLGGPITGRASSTKAHSLDAALIAQTNGTLLISDCTVTFTNTIDFAGNGTNAGIQVEPGSRANGILVLEGAARLGANDDQNVNLTSGTNNAVVNFSQDADYTYKGTISGNGNLQKFGNTTLTLAKNQTFTGSLYHFGGTIVLNGIDLAAGSVMVIPSATLAGSGIVTAGGGANSNIGGTLSPGVGSGNVGKLTFGKANRDNVTLSASAKLIVDIQGTNADLVEVGGDILIENINGTGATLELGTVAGFVPAKAEYVILSAIGGTITGVDPRNGNPAALPPDFDGSKTFTSANGIEFEVIHRTVNDPRRGTIDQIILYSPLGGGTATPVVPEPSTYALCGALGALALSLHRHRRRNHNNRNKPHAS